jgi:hypothetical protein
MSFEEMGAQALRHALMDHWRIEQPSFASGSPPASFPRVGRWTRGDLQGPEVWFAGVDDLPAADTAELCHEHQDCIKGFKATATGDLAPLAGWWHFVWDQENMQWNITDPTGENGYVVVQSVDASFPPAALINAAPGILLQPIVSIIEEEGLFPPIRSS